ncbi:MAG: hypothetical protein V4515_14925 [Chloroflexota bacterium]
MDLTAVKRALAAAVTTAQIDLNGRRITATAFATDAIVEPHFFCAEYIGQYHKTYGGLMNVALTCRLFVSRADDKSGQEACDEAASSTGAGSLLATLEAARGAPGQKALSGAADDFVVQRVSGPRLYQIGQVEYYGLEFGLFVMG